MGRVDKSLVSYLLILFLTFVIVVQLLSHVQLFATLWTAAGQASLSFTVSWALLKFMSIESVIVSNQLILCCPLLLPSSISQHQSLFQGVGSSHQVAKMLDLQLQHQSFQWIFMVDSLYWLVWSPCCPKEIKVIDIPMYYFSFLDLRSLGI